MNTKKIVEFHVGRGGKFYNAGHMTFCGCDLTAKHQVEENNFMAFENESEIIKKHGDEVIDLITDLNYDVNSDEYRYFCEKYGYLGKVVLNDCSGNYIGDYVPDGEEYYYDEDGQYDTTAGKLINGWNDLSENEKNAINESEIAYIYDLEFGDRPDADLNEIA